MIKNPPSDYQKALAEVKARVTASRTSFGAGMAVLPRERREGMYALYAFCREVDDIADGDSSAGTTPELRREMLQEWRGRIGTLFHNYQTVSGTTQVTPAKAGVPLFSKSWLKQKNGTPAFAGVTCVSSNQQTTNGITTTLRHAIRRFNLIEKDLQEIIDGMEMDAGDPIVAPDMKTLDLYCDRVASAVGRASVRIFGDDTENAQRVAHHLGRALQLTNILRDLAEDAARGRLYLPYELLAKHDVSSFAPDAVLHDKNLPAVCRDLADIAKKHFTDADAAMKLCNRSAMRPARIMRAYYGAIFERLVVEDWRNPFQRVSLPKWKKIWLAIRHMV